MPAVEGALDLVIRKLGPELLDDYLRFFDADAFEDFPWWSVCYCGFFHDPCADDEWDPGPEAGPEHRAFKAELIRSGEATGLLAYARGRVVGWCNAAPRASY